MTKLLFERAGIWTHIYFIVPSLTIPVSLYLLTVLIIQKNKCNIWNNYTRDIVRSSYYLLFLWLLLLSCLIIQFNHIFSLHIYAFHSWVSYIFHLFQFTSSRLNVAQSQYDYRWQHLCIFKRNLNNVNQLYCFSCSRMKSWHSL